MQAPHTQWNGAADWYDQNMGEAGDTLNRMIIRPLVLDMLGGLRDKKLLDVGCGSGYLTAELANSADMVHGVDFSENFVSICRRKYEEYQNLDFSVQDITEPFSLGDSSFDAILCKMVLQYTPSITVFAKECERLLLDGGDLLIVVDHPFRAAYFNAIQDAPEKNLYSGQPQVKTGLWGKTELTWYPRTMEQYIQSFIDAGLRLAEIREPLAETNDSNTIPFSVLALKFTK